MKVRDIAPYGIRMPSDLKERLQERAKKNGRSLNSEIVHILEDYITPPHVEDMKPLSEDELASPEKLQDWMKEIASKIVIMEKALKKSLSEDK